jgi:hypothetical protein
MKFKIPPSTLKIDMLFDLEFETASALPSGEKAKNVGFKTLPLLL